MATVYSAPQEIKKPEFNFRDMKAYREAQNAYIEQVKAWAKAKSKDQYAGEEVFLPHADGKACYIVFSAKPVKLIHLEIGDAWDAPLAHRMLTKDIVQHVEGNRKFAQLRASKV